MTPNQMYYNIGENFESVKIEMRNLIQSLTSDIEAMATILYIGIGVLAILGVVIIVNQIKIKKMLRKLTEKQDKP